MACNLRGTRVVPWHVGTDTGVPSTWAPVAWEGDFETTSTSCRDEARPDGSEFRRENHLGCIPNHVNNEINYQPQLVQEFFHFLALECFSSNS